MNSRCTCTWRRTHTDFASRSVTGKGGVSIDDALGNQTGEQESGLLRLDEARAVLCP